jgi:hypothetical protein
MAVEHQMDDYRLGWERPTDQLRSLRFAVKCLGKAWMSLSNRLDLATRALVYDRYVPERLKHRYENIMNARIAVAKGHYFAFHLLSHKERRALANDIFALYEACLLDIGRMYEMGGIATVPYDITYPKDAAPFTVKPRSDLCDNLPPNGVTPHVNPSRAGNSPREPQYALPDDPETIG